MCWLWLIANTLWTIVVPSLVVGLVMLYSGLLILTAQAFCSWCKSIGWVLQWSRPRQLGPSTIELAPVTSNSTNLVQMGRPGGGELLKIIVPLPLHAIVSTNIPLKTIFIQPQLWRCALFTQSDTVCMTKITANQQIPNLYKEKMCPISVSGCILYSSFTLALLLCWERRL
jgi:hypothetical protein